MSGAIRSLVERHARGLEDIAAAMQKDGIGLHSTRGHVPVLRRMAEAMRGDATRGKTPHDFVDSLPTHRAASTWGPVTLSPFLPLSLRWTPLTCPQATDQADPGPTRQAHNVG